MKVAIIGGAESGIGAALLAKKNNYEVFVSDFGEIPEKYKDELRHNEIPFEEKGHTIERLIDAGFVIKSPGVPDTAPVLRSLKKEGLKVISEIEFGYSFYSGKLIAITGSNGKTTTSGLIYHVLKNAGRDVEIGGNYGISFARILTEKQPEYMVLEVSSFQLDTIDQFKPDIALVLNITADHLDRYEYDIMKYGAAKMRIIENQTEEETFVFNGDDPIIAALYASKKRKERSIPIREADYAEGISSKEDNSKFEISIKGKHNLFNARCAVEVARIIGLTEGEIASGLQSFKNEPHRMELVDEINGVKFINDSKATNVDSVFYALDAIKSDVIWIAGGTDKGNDYTALKKLAKQKVKALICLGIDNQKLVQSFAELIPIIIESTKVSNVVDNALDLASAGDTVILSPACASFDLFENYTDRGDQFKRSVLELKNKISRKNRKI
ncbi:MAG: UDP-N-acetylmuramoyl-L-alanine--D-glutamate ligase [Saprospiraceae bacterium]|nr:UDP-N-acetylmuramoyl-L-alanine--D-glutamate ligase [Saprospiraceae bacterium]